MAILLLVVPFSVTSAQQSFTDHAAAYGDNGRGVDVAVQSRALNVRDLPTPAVQWTACAVADLNGDKAVDYVAGASGVRSQAGSGMVIALSSRSMDVIWAVQAAGNESLGSSICDIGDWNADHVDDFAIGAPADYFAHGSVVVISGRDGSVVQRIEPRDTLTGFGSVVASGTDIDHDGRNDIFIACPGWRRGMCEVTPEECRGRVMVWLTRTQSLEVVLQSGDVADEFGAEMCLMPLARESGRIALAVSAPNWSAGPALQQVGKVIVSTIDGSRILSSVQGTQEHGRFGGGLSAACLPAAGATMFSIVGDAATNNRLAATAVPSGKELWSAAPQPRAVLRLALGPIEIPASEVVYIVTAERTESTDSEASRDVLELLDASTGKSVGSAANHHGDVPWSIASIGCGYATSNQDGDRFVNAIFPAGSAWLEAKWRVALGSDPQKAGR